MSILKPFYISILPLALLILSGCGGSGAAGDDAAPQSPPVSSQSTSSSAIVVPDSSASSSASSVASNSSQQGGGASSQVSSAVSNVNSSSSRSSLSSFSSVSSRSSISSSGNVPSISSSVSSSSMSTPAMSSSSTSSGEASSYSSSSQTSSSDANSSSSSSSSLSSSNLSSSSVMSNSSGSSVSSSSSSSIIPVISSSSSTSVSSHSSVSSLISSSSSSSTLISSSVSSSSVSSSSVSSSSLSSSSSTASLPAGIVNWALDADAYAFTPKFVDGYPLASVNDGATTGSAFKLNYVTNGYVELVLERMVEVHEIIVHSGQSGSTRYAMQKFSIQANNGGCYQTLPGGTYNLPDDRTRSVTLSLATPYVTDRIRLAVQDASAQIREIEVRGIAFNGPRTTTMNCGNPGGMVVAKAAGYDYALYLPPGYNLPANKNVQYPLIISLHGLGGKTLDTNHTAVQGNPEGFIRQMKKAHMVNNFPAIVIAPHFAPAGNSGSGWLNPASIHALTLAAAHEFRVHPERIIPTGLSAGGSAVKGIIENYRDTIYAAFVPVAFQGPNKLELYCLYTKAPIWVFASHDDNLGHTPYAWLDTKNNKIPANCGATGDNIKVTAYDDIGHSAALWDGAYSDPDLHAFMLSIWRSDWIGSSYAFP